MANERFDRHDRIGWDQKKIQNSSVSVLGNNSLYVQLFLNFLGFNNTVYVTDKPNFGNKFMNISLNKEKPLEHLAKTLNSDSNAFQHDSKLPDRYLQELVKQSEIIVETRQTQKDREKTLHYLNKWGKTGVFISNHNNAVLVHTYRPEITDLTDNKQLGFLLHTQDKPFEQLMLYGGSAHVAGEVVQHILDFGQKSKNPFFWNVAGNDRFWFDTDYDFKFDTNDFSDLNILMAGVGGTGVNMAYGVVNFFKPKSLHPVEPDTIALSNLNRQFPYYDMKGIGKKKVHEIERVLKNKDTQIFAYDEYFSEDFQPKGNIDLVLDCTSGFDNRLKVHNFAKANNLKLISIGASAFDADANTYIPDLTGCFDCQYGIINKGIYDAIEGAIPGCDLTPEGSNIVTTAIAASFGLGEIPSAMFPEKYGNSPQKSLLYRLNNEEKTGSVEVSDPCDCKTTTLDKTELAKMNYAFDENNNLAEVYSNGILIEKN